MSTNTNDLGTLVTRVIANGQRLAKAQVGLFQAEAKATGEQIATVSAMAVVALGAALLFVVFLLITIAYGIVALGLPVWAGFGIVTLLLLITALVFALLAKKQAEGIKGPQVAVAELHKTQETLGALGKRA